jgi:hypothetical protein
MLQLHDIFWPDRVSDIFLESRWSVATVLDAMIFAIQDQVLLEQQGNFVFPRVGHQPIHGFLRNEWPGWYGFDDAPSSPLSIKHDDGAALVGAHVFRNSITLRQPRTLEFPAGNYGAGLVNPTALGGAMYTRGAQSQFGFCCIKPAFTAGRTRRALSVIHACIIDNYARARQRSLVLTTCQVTTTARKKRDSFLPLKAHL